MEKYVKQTKELLDFIDKSPSVFHVTDNIINELEKAGFEELKEKNSWELEAGKGYYVVRNDAAIIAFRLPEISKDHIKGFHMIAAHGDSPCFKVKEQPEIKQDNRYIKLNTEKYGGMILSTWFDRPLSVAGRLVVREEEGLKSVPVNVDKDLLVIPSLAIHMNREANKGMELNPQVDTLPLFAQTGEEEPGKELLKIVAECAGVSVDDILGHDLFVYVRDRGRFLGADGEFILAPRLDDLQCVYAGLQAMLESVPKEYINVFAMFDNEEVGSGSRQGADSDFLQDILERICTAADKGREHYLRLMADSFMLSADNAHAVHPNHPEKSDPTNRPYLNGGPVIKFHAGQKYTTDGVTAAYVKNMCRQAKVPFQTYTNRSDMAGGSTLGNIATTHVSVASADIGLPQLAMHSAVETAGTKDLYYGIKLFKIFLGQ